MLSFEKLGFSDDFDVVVCVKYYVLLNSMGGVVVEYMLEIDIKVWVWF